MVDAALSLADANEEEATEDAISVDVAVLVAEAIVGVVETRGAAVVLDAEVTVGALDVFGAGAAVSGREEVVEAVSTAARCAGE